MQIKQVCNIVALLEVKIIHKLKGEKNEELTDREIEILELLTEGMNNQDMANQLYISENTVKNHIRSILVKLSAQNRTHALVKALKKEIVEL